MDVKKRYLGGTFNKMSNTLEISSIMKLRTWGSALKYEYTRGFGIGGWSWMVQGRFGWREKQPKYKRRYCKTIGLQRKLTIRL